jgi:hypothetical protein
MVSSTATPPPDSFSTIGTVVVVAPGVKGAVSYA